MTYDELLKTVCDSLPTHWNQISCGGFGAGPSYLSAPDGQGGEMDHYCRAAYRSDVSLGLAFGLSPVDDQRDFEFLKHFADRRSHPTFLDIFWNGMLVHREMGLVVDGGRMTLPWPRQPVDASPSRDRSEVVAELVSKQAAALWRLVAEFEGHVGPGDSFDEYLAQAGFVVV
jgi:hypothetical protein